MYYLLLNEFIVGGGKAVGNFIRGRSEEQLKKVLKRFKKEKETKCCELCNKIYDHLIEIVENL